MLDGIIFDKDGTLFGFRASWGGWSRKVLADLARDPDHAEQLAEAIGFDLQTLDFAPDSLVIAGTMDEVAGALHPHLAPMLWSDLVVRLNTIGAANPMVPAVPLKPFFAALKARGVRIGLATNDSEAPARAHLAAHDLTQYFDFIAGYDSGHGGKPAAGQLLAFAASTGLDPARCAMVGDSAHDLVAGRAAGMTTIAVLTGIALREDLAPLADVVFDDISEILPWLAGQSPA